MKKTIRIGCGMPMHINGYTVPWDDVWVKFSINRRRASWYPCVIGLSSLRSDIKLNEKIISSSKWSEDMKKQGEEDLKALKNMLHSYDILYIKGAHESGCWDEIFYPKESLDKRAIEGAITFGLRERYGITVPLRFKWDKPKRYVTPVG